MARPKSEAHDFTPTSIQLALIAKIDDIGVSDKKLRLIADCGQPHIWKFKNNEGGCSLEFIDKITAGLGLTVRFDQDESAPPVSSSKFERIREAYKLMREKEEWADGAMCPPGANDSLSEILYYLAASSLTMMAQPESLDTKEEVMNLLKIPRNEWNDPYVYRK